MIDAQTSSEERTVHCAEVTALRKQAETSINGFSSRRSIRLANPSLCVHVEHVSSSRNDKGGIAPAGRNRHAPPYRLYKQLLERQCRHPLLRQDNPCTTPPAMLLGNEQTMRVSGVPRPLTPRKTVLPSAVQFCTGRLMVCLDPRSR